MGSVSLSVQSEVSAVTFYPSACCHLSPQVMQIFFFLEKTQRLMGKSGDTRPSTGHTRVEERRRINLEFSLYGREAAFGFSESMMWKIRQIYFQFSSLNTHQFVGLALACHLQKRRTELFIRREKLLLRRKRKKKLSGYEILLWVVNGNQPHQKL